MLEHVGSHYDLEIDGKPMRIVIVGQEYGHPPPRVDLKGRRAMVLDTGDKVRWHDRDPHMKGTTTLLRLLHKRRPGDDAPGEHLTLDSDEPIHLFQGFALANYLLCSRVHEHSERGKPRRQGRPTDTMFRNCTRHFMKAIDILEPTVLLLPYKARDKFDEAYHFRWNTVDNYELLDLD